MSETGQYLMFVAAIAVVLVVVVFLPDVFYHFRDKQNEHDRIVKCLDKTQDENVSMGIEIRELIGINESYSREIHKLRYQNQELKVLYYNAITRKDNKNG